jgi:uncharacterized iron-regulated protein
LDDYIAGRIDDQALFARTEWEQRWYWSFDAYLPVLRMCRNNGVELVALDVDSEDKAKVEIGGLASLDPARLREYISDANAFSHFGSTRAFDEYVAYTLQPPYKLMKKMGQKMTMSTNIESDMTFENFLARQCLRDEAMATASLTWLARNPTGLLFGLVGVNHGESAWPGLKAGSHPSLPPPPPPPLPLSLIDRRPILESLLRQSSLPAAFQRA